MNSAILVMAAGFGRRFRQSGTGNKLLAMLNGKPVLQHTLENARATGRPVFVVSQPSDEAVHRLTESESLIVCSSQGLGESLAAGIRACSDYDGWVITLGDMPWLQTTSYLAVIHALETSPLVRPVINGQPGHPVGFQRQFYAELSSLSGDTGAKTVLQNSLTHFIELQDQGCLLDVDYPAALYGKETA